MELSDNTFASLFHVLIEEYIVDLPPVVFANAATFYFSILSESKSSYHFFLSQAMNVIDLVSLYDNAEWSEMGCFSYK